MAVLLLVFGVVLIAKGIPPLDGLTNADHPIWLTSRSRAAPDRWRLDMVRACAPGNDSRRFRCLFRP